VSSLWQRSGVDQFSLKVEDDFSRACQFKEELMVYYPHTML